MAVQLDGTGYHGKLRSLAGLLGREGAGLEVKQTAFAIGGTNNVLNANGKRVWALIQNLGTTKFHYSFGPAAAASGDHQLPPGGVLQIDDHLPWAGALSVTWDGTTATVCVTEASLSQV